MTWNLLKSWKQRRKQKKALKQQERLLQTWVWLERLYGCGQLSFDYKTHRLFIIKSFATLLLAKGTDGWINSIHAIYQYVYFKQAQGAWERFMHKEELAAVRKSLSPGPSPVREGSKKRASLTRDDIERIKRSRRAEIVASDMEPIKVEAFEFFIIPDGTEAKVEPIAIGYYDPTTGEMEVAAWDEVKGAIQSLQNKRDYG